MARIRGGGGEGRGVQRRGRLSGAVVKVRAALRCRISASPPSLEVGRL